jgi:hypothetical protein
MKKVITEKKDPCCIRRSSDEIISDDFKFSSDQNIILAMPNKLELAKRNTFSNPTRERIASSAARSNLSFESNLRTLRRNGRISNLIEEIVNSAC